MELFCSVTRFSCTLLRYITAVYIQIRVCVCMCARIHTRAQSSVKRGSIHAVDLRNLRYNEQRAADFLDP